jgi:hypothetical protein
MGTQYCPRRNGMRQTVCKLGAKLPDVFIVAKIRFLRVACHIFKKLKKEWNEFLEFIVTADEVCVQYFTRQKKKSGL